MISFSPADVPQVVGDGNFAVVRVCYSRHSRKEFAVKIIDKVKSTDYRLRTTDKTNSANIRLIPVWSKYL